MDTDNERRWLHGKTNPVGVDLVLPTTLVKARGDGETDPSRTVVASVYVTDEVGLLLLLNPKPPYYSLATFYIVDCDGSEPGAIAGLEARAGELIITESFSNIVPATEAYENQGGA